MSYPGQFTFIAWSTTGGILLDEPCSPSDIIKQTNASSTCILLIRGAHLFVSVSRGRLEHEARPDVTAKRRPVPCILSLTPKGQTREVMSRCANLGPVDRGHGSSEICRIGAGHKGETEARAQWSSGSRNKGCSPHFS